MEISSYKDLERMNRFGRFNCDTIRVEEDGAAHPAFFETLVRKDLRSSA